MPVNPPRVCPSCRATVKGRCPTCHPEQRADVDQRRGHAAARGYGRHWRVVRRAFLRKPGNGLCRLCLARNIATVATIADHWPDTLRTLQALGVPDPHADRRLRPLCEPCHDRYGEKGLGRIG